MRSLTAPGVSTLPDTSQKSATVRKPLRLCLLGLLSAAATLALPAQATPSGFDLTLGKAMELHEAGGFEAAIQIYQSLREDQPNDPHLLYELSRSSLAVNDLTGCIQYARSSAVEASKYQAAAFGMLARCEREAGSVTQALATYETAVGLHPESAALRFDYGLALRGDGAIAAADAQFALALQGAVGQPSLYLDYGNLIGARSEAGALLMNLRYIMAAPQSPLAVGAAERILALLDQAPEQIPDPSGNVFDIAFLEARQATQKNNGESVSDAARLSRFLQRFVLNIVNAVDPELARTVLWTGAVEPMLAMAEHDVLDTYLYFVAALARTDGSPEWLSEHRQKFERLVEYLARTEATS